MGPKRHSPLDDPPPASSSGEGDEDGSEDIDQEEERSEEEEEEVGGGKENAQEGNEEEDDGDESEEEEEEPKVVQITSPAEMKSPLPIPASTNGEPESETDSDRTQPSTSAFAFTIKAIGSKIPKNSSDPANGKRSFEAESNPKKVKESANGGKKKRRSPRVWNDEEEIVLLNSIIEFSAKNGVEPQSDMAAFYEFMKDSILCNGSKKQLGNKVRGTKLKYQINVGKGKNWAGPKFWNPHERKVFDLSKKIWGDVDGIVASDGKNKGKTTKEIEPKSPDGDLMEVEKKEEEESEEEQEVNYDSGNHSWSKHPNLKAVMELGLLGTSSFLNGSLEEWLSMIGGKEKADELEEKWRIQWEAEHDLQCEKIGLIQEALAAAASGQAESP